MGRRGTDFSDQAFPPAIDIFAMDENAVHLLGWPGYRHTRGSWGLSPVETQAEWAHMRGRMILWLVTGQFKIRNPVWILLASAYGGLSASPILLLLAGEEGRAALLGGLLGFAPYIIIGLLILANMAKCIVWRPHGRDIMGQ